MLPPLPGTPPLLREPDFKRWVFYRKRKDGTRKWFFLRKLPVQVVDVKPPTRRQLTDDEFEKMVENMFKDIFGFDYPY